MKSLSILLEYMFDQSFSYYGLFTEPLNSFPFSPILDLEE